MATRTQPTDPSTVSELFGRFANCSVSTSA